MIQTEQRAVATIMTIPEPIQVSCYAGGRGGETPRAFRSSGRPELAVARVLTRWIQEDLRRVQKEYFEVLASDSATYRLYRDVALDLWFCEREAPEGKGTP
jgi:hypothetical protein